MSGVKQIEEEGEQEAAHDRPKDLVPSLPHHHLLLFRAEREGEGREIDIDGKREEVLD